MASPFFNTFDVDKMDFQAERKVFLEAQTYFKSGVAPYGLTALNHLTSMYFTLLITHHIPNTNSKYNSQTFLTGIEQLKAELQAFIIKNQEREEVKQMDGSFLRVPDFPKYLTKFDEQVKTFYLIKAECGL
jgi:hypothetical protein